MCKYISQKRMDVIFSHSLFSHYNDVIMSKMASQITSLTIVYSTVYLSADLRKHQSSAPLAFALGIHREPVNSPHKWPVTRKMFPFDDVIMCQCYSKDHPQYCQCVDGLLATLMERQRRWWIEATANIGTIWQRARVLIHPLAPGRNTAWINNNINTKEWGVIARSVMCWWHFLTLAHHITQTGSCERSRIPVHDLDGMVPGREK